MPNMDYVTVDLVAAQIDRIDSSKSLEIGNAITAASRRIDGHCGRRFYADAAPSSRLFRSLTNCLVIIDDCSDVDTVKTDTGGDGTFATTWTAADYITLPYNGVGHNGESGWPVTGIYAVETLDFYTGDRRPQIQVTGTWGWATVPDLVKQACLQLAIMYYRSPDAPFGTTGIADLGITRVRMPQTVKEMLADYAIGGTAVPRSG